MASTQDYWFTPKALSWQQVDLGPATGCGAAVTAFCANSQGWKPGVDTVTVEGTPAAPSRPWGQDLSV